MDERHRIDVLNRVLKATADPTRRAILTHLAQEGPMRVTGIAARFSISLNSVSKHIMVLESAGLVTRSTHWREHLIALEPEPLSEIDRWSAELRSIWELRLEALEAAVAKEKDND